jgi:hypothetical protein
MACRPRQQVDDQHACEDEGHSDHFRKIKRLVMDEPADA